MTTREEAMAIAQEFLDHNYREENLGVFGAEDMGPAYLCYFNTRKYLETRDSSDGLGPGLGPIGVPKDGSTAWMLRGAGRFAEQIAEKFGS